MTASSDGSQGDAGRYRFPPLEQRGLIAGWRGGQVAVVAGALVLAVGSLRSVGGTTGVVVAVLLVAGSAAAVSWPVRGRTVEQWAPVVVRFAVSRLTSGAGVRERRRGRGRTGGPLDHLVLYELSTSPSPSLTPAAEQDRCSSAPVEGRPLAAAVGSGPIGVLRDRLEGTWTVVASAGGSGFALAPPDEQRQRIGAWSRALATFARDRVPVHRVQWIARSVPHDGGPAILHFEEGAVTDQGSRESRSYRDLLAEGCRGLTSHEVHVAVSVRSARDAKVVFRQAPGREVAEALAHQAASLERRLAEAGTHVDGVLSPQALARLLSRSLALEESDQSLSRESWRPAQAEESWSAFRTDTAWHTTHWIAEWPRIDVAADFLVPLLVRSAASRSVSLTMEPVPLARAIRDVERSRTSGAADLELRQRHGFGVTARTRREQEGVLRREAELADGHASFRVSGYVTVSAGDAGGLESASAEAEHAAATTGLDLRRLFGEQAVAFTYTLPCGRGLS